MAEKAQEKKGGDLPRGWKKTTVGEFCPFIYGKGLHKKLRDPSGQIPVFGSNGIVSTHSSPYVHEPGVIIGRKGSIGSVAFSKKPFWPIDTTFYITADSHRDLRYTFYLLKSIGLEHMNSDSAVPGLNRNAAHSREIVVPPLSEQRRIAGILGSLDDKIELNRRISETLEAISQAIFKSWFIDFDPAIDNALAAGNKIPEALQARAKARQAMGDKRQPLPPSIQSLFPAEFESTPQGPIPKGWKITTVGDEFNITMGQSPPGSTYNKSGDGLLFYQGNADFGFRYPSERVYCTGPKKYAEKGDTLVSVRAPIGDINMAIDKCCIGRGISAIRHKKACSSYTYYSILALRERLRDFEANGTIFGSISRKDFDRIKWIKSSNLAIEKYESLAGKLNEKIEKCHRNILSQIKIRDTILPKLLSGRISSFISTNVKKTDA